VFNEIDYYRRKQRPGSIEGKTRRESQLSTTRK